MKKENLVEAIGNLDSKYVLEAEALNKSQKNSSKIIVLFKRAPIAACLVLCMLFGVVAYATYEVYNWSTSIWFDNDTTIEIADNMHFKRIPDNAYKTDYDNGIGKMDLSHNEVEEMLGFNILCCENANTESVIYDSFQNDNGSIGRVDLWWPHFIEIEDKRISYRASMLNEGADEGYILAFQEGIDAIGGKELENTINVFINSVETKVVIYRYDDTEERLNATFVYDDILYNLSGYGYTQEEMISVIKQMY